MAYKKGQFDVVELMAKNQFMAFCINAQHVNGMTPFDLDVYSGKSVKKVHMHAY